MASETVRLILSDTDPPELRTFASFVRDHWEQADFPSTRALASRIGVSHTTIHAVLSGERVPSWRVARDLLQYLEADLIDSRRLWIAARAAEADFRDKAEAHQDHRIQNLADGPAVRPIEVESASFSARTELADRLKLAWIKAGRPSLSDVGDEVGYSKASISKVLAGKMAPAWQLVRKLGATLGVPRETVQDEWHALWIAADIRRRHDFGNSLTPSLERGEPGRGEVCRRCGAWVVDLPLHEEWHWRLEALFNNQEPMPPRGADDMWNNLRSTLRRANDRLDEG